MLQAISEIAHASGGGCPAQRVVHRALALVVEFVPELVPPCLFIGQGFPGDHHGALLLLWQRADALNVLHQLGRRPALARRRLWLADQLLDTHPQRAR
ncbi:hypothetical protein [Variovorax boronicumulans]|uniref:hypothetical protein n=1 Tax=Variovorax boronicumulans TaxID=436515 RepID=UPI00339A4183